MIKNLIRAVIAFLAGAVITHTYWYQVNLRLQRHHKRELNRSFANTRRHAYNDGFNHGRWHAKIESLLTPPALTKD